MPGLNMALGVCSTGNCNQLLKPYYIFSMGTDSTASASSKPKTRE
jgi:hypothetical protein